MMIDIFYKNLLNYQKGFKYRSICLIGPSILYGLFITNRNTEV